MRKLVFHFLLMAGTLAIYGQNVTINEVDVDQDPDTQEFIELKGLPNQSLDGLVVVLFNGNIDNSYNAIDLSGFNTDADGFFIIGGNQVPDVDIALGESNVLQNGPDSVAIYEGNIADFPDGTPATTVNLIDAIVYDTNDADDTGLLSALGQTIQYNEGGSGNSTGESLQRASNGFCTASPSLRAANNCPNCTFEIQDIITTCDAITANTDTVTVTIEYTGGGQELLNIELSEGILSGDDPSVTRTGTIIITEVSEASTLEITVSGILCFITGDIVIPECEPTPEVNDIASLRSQIIGEEYLLTGEAIVTFTQSFRNQIFLEDATAAILIDDPQGIITTTYSVGDGIAGIMGTLNEFGGQLQFTPLEDPGTASSIDNAITPQIITLTELNANPEQYESELIGLEDITIDNTQSTWIINTDYPMTAIDGSFTFRTLFQEVDYIDDPVPEEPVTVAGIVTENNGSYFFTARDLADLALLSINDNVDVSMALYPNPATDIINLQINEPLPNLGFILIEGSTGKILTREQLAPNTLNQIDISKYNTGLYFFIIHDTNSQKTLALEKFIKR